MWKKCIKQTSETTILLVVEDLHLLMGSRIIILEKLSSKELYSLLISAIDQYPTLQRYFDNLFPNIELPSKEMYLIACKAIVNSHLHCFHYKIINNVLYLNNKLFQFSKTHSTLCFFVRLKLKQHSIFFHKCSVLKFFGMNFHYFLKQILTLLVEQFMLPFLVLSMNRKITQIYFKITYFSIKFLNQVFRFYLA